MFEMKNVALLVKLHSFLIKIYGSVVCFLLLKCVCVFTNGAYGKLFTMLFITPICVSDFCETVHTLVKKQTPCQSMI